MDPVLDIVERSNQRGRRMLSVVDLLEADTLDLEQAAWLLARIEEGASWLVGARPGGAGKTTIMSALLAMLPDGEPIHLATPRSGWETAAAGECVVAYEISPAPYEAYLWGDDLRRLAALGARGCRIVTNLHADTLDEARGQVVGDNSVRESHFDEFDIFIPIEVRGRMGRVPRVPRLHHCRDGAWEELGPSPGLSAREEAIATFLERTAATAARTVAEVRSEWLAWVKVGNEAPG